MVTFNFPPLFVLAVDVAMVIKWGIGTFDCGWRYHVSFSAERSLKYANISCWTAALTVDLMKLSGPTPADHSPPLWDLDFQLKFKIDFRLKKWTLTEQWPGPVLLNAVKTLLESLLVQEWFSTGNVTHVAHILDVETLDSHRFTILLRLLWFLTILRLHIKNILLSEVL